MRFLICDLRFTIYAACALVMPIASATAQTTHAPQPIDLPTALRLAGAQNLDVKIAQERLAEAKANHQSAVAQFFPWLSPGITHRQHNDRIQDVAGNLIDVNKSSYAPGAALVAQVDLGDAIYKSLASKQLANAAGHALEAQRQDTVLAAAQGYFELALAQGAVAVARDAVKISSDYSGQIRNAVEAGIALKGDALRAAVQMERNELTLRRAEEQQRIAAARLAQTLHLNPAVELVAQEAELVPLALIETNATLNSLMEQMLAARPELQQSRSLVFAAKDAKTGATFGPLIPTVGAQAFWGGLGGGRSGVADTFGPQQDYSVGVGWRIGPGGLFDFTRIHASDARLKAARFGMEKLRDELMRQVVEAFTRWQSLARQISTVQRALAAAEEGLRLAQQRKEFAVGIALETLQAEQDLTRSRLDYLKIIAEFNQTQYALGKLTGTLPVQK